MRLSLLSGKPAKVLARVVVVIGFPILGVDMDPIIGGALISSGASLLGNLLGKKPPSINKQMDRSYEAMNAAAEKYGVSKLVTFGGGVPPVGGATSVGGDLPSTLASMGQDIGRAVAAKASGPERELAKLALEKAGLENEYLRSQIASVNNRTLRESAPALPIPDRSGNRLSVAHPNLGQDAENHYSDIGGNILGTSALVNDTDRDVTRWMIDNMGFDPRLYTPWSMGKEMGKAVRKALERGNPWMLPRHGKGSTHYKNKW